MKKVVITINPDGTSKIDAQNFAGIGCAKATQAMELALAGDGPVEDKKKPEDYFAKVGQGNTQRL